MENLSDEHDYYTDFSMSNTDIAQVQEQLAKILATAFAFVLSVTEFIEYVNSHKKGGSST